MSEQAKTPATESRTVRANKIAVWCAVAALAMIALVVFVGSIMEYNSLQKEKQGLERDIERVSQSIDRYQHDIAAPMDDEYIESVAKDKLGLINPDEQIVHGDK